MVVENIEGLSCASRLSTLRPWNCDRIRSFDGCVGFKLCGKRRIGKAAEDGGPEDLLSSEISANQWIAFGKCRRLRHFAARILERCPRVAAMGDIRPMIPDRCCVVLGKRNTQLGCKLHGTFLELRTCSRAFA